MTQTGYVQSYFFGVQQQLPGGVVMDLAYVGNKGTHLQILADYNQAQSARRLSPSTARAVLLPHVVLSTTSATLRSPTAADRRTTTRSSSK